MKSKTTRRSHPMIRSRLRNPTSKSMTTVRCPRNANPAAKAAAEVVLPTPPLPEVSTITLPAKTAPLFPSISGDGQPLIDERDLHRETLLFRGELLADEIATGNADELGLEPAAEDSRIDVAAGAGQGAATERAINMDIAVGDDLRPGADRGGDDEIGAARIDLGARANRLGHQPGLGSGRRHRRRAAGRLVRRAPARLRRVRRKAREPGAGGGLELRRRRILHADQGQGVVVKQLLRLDKLRLVRELDRFLQVEH